VLILIFMFSPIPVVIGLCTVGTLVNSISAVQGVICVPTCNQCVLIVFALITVGFVILFVFSFSSAVFLDGEKTTYANAVQS